MEVVDNDYLEYSRVKKLNELDLDYQDLQNEFYNLVKLAVNITGTQISLVNLIDSYTQWTVSANSSEFTQMEREESICDHTIRDDKILEVKRLDQDIRFKDREFVQGGLKYYLGIPLKVRTGENIGALCIIDQEEKNISAHQKKCLELIAREIVAKLEGKQKINELHAKLEEISKQRNQLAHDVRGGLAGIQGLAELVETETLGEEEFRSYFEMINKSATGLLDLTDDVLQRHKEGISENYFTLSKFENKLKNLYQPTAKNKSISLNFYTNPSKSSYRFSRRKLLPIAGNLISNAIKFTRTGGEIKVLMDIVNLNENYFLKIEVKDTGRGIAQDKLQLLQHISSQSSPGTNGEEGYGLGLNLVSEMVKSLEGEIKIDSKLGVGTRVLVSIPV